jgi:hypothetical protein
VMGELDLSARTDVPLDATRASFGGRAVAR